VLGYLSGKSSISNPLATTLLLTNPFKATLEANNS